MIDTVMFDVDGTLVDSNYQNVRAWDAAFRASGVRPPLWRIHRAIGMGGDRLVAAAAGDDVEQEHGDQIRARWRKEYDTLIDGVLPLEGARDLLAAVRARGITVALASSSPAEHLEHHLDLLDARGVVDAWTTASDVESTKPAPDLVQVTMDKVGARSAVMIGDTSWDVEAAARIDVPCYGVLTGGFGASELTDAGARKVYASLPDLVADLDHVTGRLG